MESQVLDPAALRRFFVSIRKDHELVGPVAREGNQHAFQVIEDLDLLVLDYVHTILPPKKYFLPPREVLLEYKLQDGERAGAVNEARPRVIVGVHPCDIAGIRHLDLSLGRENEDANYRAKRAAAILIGVECLPDEFCFCGSVGTLRPRGGFDLFLTDLGGRWLLDIGTERGEALRKAHAPESRAAAPSDQEAREEHYRRKQAMQKARLHADPTDLPLLFEGAFKDPVWDRVAERCLGCGTCTQVCPTCYCFDVDDEVKILEGEGARTRTWDSCQLRAFTEVAGGEVFREKLSRRLRHRVYRKFHYLHTRFNEPNCTGCGRCGRQCVAGIRMDEVVNELLASMVGVRMGGGRR